MIKDKRILALIPARGGSKGLPGKNILPLLGKPLIAWTIENALLSKYLDKVLVSTDYQEIAEIARKFGAEAPFLRPAELATDQSPTIDTIFHALDFFENQGLHFDYLALLEPTSPLRKEGDIDKAIEILYENDAIADSVVSVGEVHMEHPAIIKKIVNGLVKPFLEKSETVLRRQDLQEVYFPYGVIYLSKTDKLRELKTFYQERTLPYFIDRWQNYEVDDIFDLVCIEGILKYKLPGDA
jgi:CMP-N,N'-diacetyllegionaminic acid synthase